MDQGRFPIHAGNDGRQRERQAAPHHGSDHRCADGRGARLHLVGHPWSVRPVRGQRRRASSCVPQRDCGGKAATGTACRHLSDVPGASQPTDGAVATMLAREGVCATTHTSSWPCCARWTYPPGSASGTRRALPHGLPRRRRGVHRGCLAGRRCHDAGAARHPLRIATGQDASETAFLSSTGRASTCCR